MKPDPHAKNGRYFIRSLYFDNMADKALREKLDGVSQREKFRIRYYDNDSSLIHLEKKSKLCSLCQKSSAEVSMEQVSRLLEGDCLWMPKTGEPLIMELYTKLKYQGLRPKTIVDYTREPFIFAPGNVRVTIDYDLRAGLKMEDFLSPDCVTVPAGDQKIILEVKFDRYLPDIIREIVQLPGCRQGAFSKYASCRILG